MPYDGLPSGARNIHDCTHFTDGVGNAHEDGSAHDRMADVELLDLGNRGHWRHVPSGQAVADVDGKPSLFAEACGSLQSAERGWVVRVVRVLSGVQLDCYRSEIARASNGVRVRIDEEARSHSGVGKPLDGARSASGSRETSRPPSVVISSRRSGTNVT